MDHGTTGDIKTIAQFFLISLALCFNLFSVLASSKLTGNGFIKLISNLSIGALVIHLIIAFVGHGYSLQSPNVYLAAISAILFLLTTLFHKDQKSLFMWGTYLGINVALGSLIYLDFAYMQLMPFLFLLSSAFLCGVITYAMTLGHWYLVVPKLSEKPLVKAALITWVILAAKILWSSYALYKNYDFFAEGTTLGSGYVFNWVMLTMRVSFGYLVIAGMSYFNWRLVNMRSIQSSTGVLYAMTFFVFIGELISSFLFFNYGLYL